MGDIEAIGDVVTGGVLGRAVEPAAGEKDGQTHETQCLNCGAPLAGPYCHQCGQHAHVHRKLSAFFHDFLHGVLHFEGKIWRTLPMLAWRPGELTRSYVAGQRARFVSPIALFLFSVFLMFAVMHTFGILDFSGRPTSSAKTDTVELSQQLQKLEKRRGERIAAGQATTVEDAAIFAIREELSDAAEQKSVKTGSVIQVDEGDERGWFKTVVGKAKKNPELLAYKVQANAYKYSWLLIPISVPFVWLLFLHRRRYREYGAYDHAVFVTYSMCFMTLLFCAATILRPIVRSNDLAVLAFGIVPPIHMYRQLRGAYDLTRWKALWRTVVLLFFAILCLSLFAMVLVALGAMD